MWELSLYSAITLPFPDETISIEILYCAYSYMHFSYIFSPYVFLETMLTRHQEGCDVYSEDMHVTWFQGPDSVSKHLDGEIYDVVVAGNLVDSRISLGRIKISDA